MSVVRFRKPAETVTAVQFQGDWRPIIDALGCTVEQLKERWPSTQMRFGKDGQREYGFSQPPGHGWTERPMPIEHGQWVIVDNGHVVGIASENSFDDWERLWGDEDA